MYRNLQWHRTVSLPLHGFLIQRNSNKKNLGFNVFVLISATVQNSNAEITTHNTLIFTAVMQSPQLPKIRAHDQKITVKPRVHREYVVIVLLINVSVYARVC